MQRDGFLSLGRRRSAAFFLDACVGKGEIKIKGVDIVNRYML